MTTKPEAGKRILARLLILALLLGAVWFVRQWRQRAHAPVHTNTTVQTTPGNSQSSAGNQQTAPSCVLEVLRYVRSNGTAPDGYVGGREFQNREKRLPAKTPGGERIRYSEWDVHPKVKGQNRGPERLVTGSDRSAWYTADHYKTFLFIDRR